MGTEDPYLYQVQVEICTKDGVEETRSIATGFREITIDPEKGMFLNGKHIKIRGVARHQDFGGVGNAVSKEQMEEDLSLVKEWEQIPFVFHIISTMIIFIAAAMKKEFLYGQKYHSSVFYQKAKKQMKISDSRWNV